LQLERFARDNNRDAINNEMIPIFLDFIFFIEEEVDCKDSESRWCHQK
jgi:hypothetical protein